MTSAASRHPRSAVRLVTLIAAALVALSGTAFGYIDPGTGSYILQVAIAFLVGLAFSIKVFWKRISAFLRRTLLPGKRKSGGSPDAP